MKKKNKETVDKKEKEILKCYRCGYISDEFTKYCPRCEEDELQILMQPYIEK